MDSARFDSLTRSLTAAGFRRRALALALSGALAPLLVREDAAAHNPLKKCKNKSGKQKKACMKKARKHNATHAAVVPPPGPTCSDQVKNGTESDVDCGGTCPRCANGKACLTANDCTNACTSGTCQACSSSPNNCGSDGGGQCSCDTRLIGGAKECTTQIGRASAASCFSAPCAAGTVCIRVSSTEARCFKPCGAP